MKEINKRHSWHNGMDSSSKVSYRQRHWSFTLNNWTKEEVAQWHSKVLEFKMKKFKIQSEVGDEKGVPHLQGTVSFIHPQRLYSVRQLLPRAHWSVTRNIKAAYDYCSKNDTFAGEAWFWEKDTSPKMEKDHGMNAQQIADYTYMERCKQLRREPDSRKEMLDVDVHDVRDPITGEMMSLEFY